MKSRTFLYSALVALTALASPAARADNMASIAITPATGQVNLTPRWSVGGNLAGFHLMAQDLSLGGGANQFYSIKASGIPAGGDIAAFTLYIAGSGAATNHADIGSKLTPDSYSALTSADPDVGFGSVNMYFIHHKASGDYFTAIVPGSGTSSAVTDLKPMDGPGGPATLGTSGYFGLTFAAANLGYGLNHFYYFRTDAVTGFTKFGTLDPALLGTSADQFDLGISGYRALAFTGSDVGFGTDKMYYLRLDPVTGFTILGTLHPVTGRAADIANLGSVFSTLTFVPGDVGFGSSQFYTTGAVNPTWQSVSFAAIADRLVSAGSFTVTPSASSGLPIVLTVVAGSTGAATISAPVAGVFTVTPTVPGIITLQATQAGQVAPIAYESNMLRQSFTATGVPIITNSPLTAAGTVGTAFSFTITAAGTPTSYTASPLPAGLSIVAATGVITGTPTTVGTTSVLLGATNAIGTGNATLTITVAAAGVAPIITNSPLTAAGTVGTAFSFTITASGTPTSYTASPLPAGLSIVAATGVITGTPTTVGPTAVLLGATNATGTGNATLTITVGAAGVAPIITNSPLTAAGTVGTPFSFAITASGSPTSYTASPLPAGLSIVAATGVITGTPTTVGPTSVLLGATNATGTGNATLTITVGAAGVAPIVTNNPLTAAGTVGTPFSFAITASGSPTSYTASPLPAGLSIVAATGVITGTPATAGTTSVLLGAINASGTGNATLTITVATVGVAPIITNNPLTAAGTVGTPFSFVITATGIPRSHTAAPLPPGLVLNTATGAITGTPTTIGKTSVLLSSTNIYGTGNATLTITVAAAGTAPIITNSPLTAAGTIGTPFSFVITASGLPTSYAASPLPAGLSIVAATGAITGIPTAVGTTSVSLGATNASGTGNATLTITVAAAGTAPIITNSPLTAAGTIGTPFSFVITASGLPTSYTATPLPAGLSIVAATGAITGIPTAVGTTSVSLGATNASGTGNATLTITVTGVSVAPTVITQPINQVVVVGGSVTFTAGGSGTPVPTYQWYHDGVLIPGATDATLTITGLKPADAGAYTATITNSAGTATTAAAILKITSSRIVNFSARALSGPGDQTLIMGFVVSGYGKHLLIRGVGPTLASYGVTNFLADPMLTLYGRNGAVATNDNWQTSSTGQDQGIAIAATAVEVGAFALPNGSKDAALLFAVDDGAHTTSMLRPNGTTGVALTEIYDTDTAPGARLVNVSARMNVTAGDGTLIAGLVIAGDAPKTVLIRGVGPTLATYGVTGVLADPMITVFAGSTPVATNDNWEVGTSTPAAIMLVSAQVGAFALPAGSKDAALVITLRPGSYSVHVTGVGATTGVALVEVYDTQ